MPGRPFRFIHASDFHLEMPPHGVVEIPDHLRDAWLDAAYAAARRVFDVAIAEEAAFLILAGDVLRPQQTGPRGAAFLAEQFARLAEHQTAVYWAGGETDPPEAWPATFPLPEHVHVFPRGRTAEMVCMRDGLPLARLVGTSRDGDGAIRPAEFEPDPAGLFSIAVAYGSVEPAAVQKRGIHYWALGGRHARVTPLSSPTMIHDPGSPQGRCPDEPGVHGCTLVQVDGQGQARPSLIPTDRFRWLSERIAMDEGATRESLETILGERIRTMLAASPNVDLLISWTLGGSGPLVGQLRGGAIHEEVLDWLRVEHGLASPAAWSVSLEIEPPANLPAKWYEQETILGDFLRAIKQYEVNAAEPLELDAYMAEPHLAGALAAAVRIGDQTARLHVLREAALLGVELLSGGEPPGQG
jgi:DNA repair exonuclease SbcCD nuclease subunit